MQIKTTYIKLKTLVIKMLTYGMSPSKIALTLTFGLMFGTIPILGITTVLLAVIALFFRLNMVMIQMANFLIYPLQLFLYLPFLRLGSMLVAKESMYLSWVTLKEILQSGWLNALTELGSIHVWAVIAWLIIWSPIAIIFYHLALKILTKIAMATTQDL